MALGTTYMELFSTLTDSLTSATQSVPVSTAIAPSLNGISLLDAKNELLLAYLQNLVFLIIIKLRHGTHGTVNAERFEDETGSAIGEAAINKLVELRVFLEKGVRPLAGRLRYRIGKVLRAADHAARTASQRPNGTAKCHKAVNDSYESDLESVPEDESNNGNDAVPVKSAAEIDDLSYRPNPTALLVPGRPADSQVSASKPDGIYRPPRVTPTALPTTVGRKERVARKPSKSATLEEFVSTELSTAPLAEPSVGSNIIAGGRKTKSEEERKANSERRTYEESNFMRLPSESKERAKRGTKGRYAGYGGEEWRGLGEGVDRIESMTQRKTSDKGVLERSRKRVLDDGPRGSVELIGARFEKRRRREGPRSRK